MKKKLPVYEFVISENDDESGVSAISIVNSPAFQSKVKLVFSKQKPQFITLADTKGKKRKIAGLALIPNEQVFRIDDLTGENYYGFFSAETIEKIVEKFHSELNNNKVNLGHNDNAFINAVLIEDFIVNSEARVQDLKEMGITHENIMGSWFTKYLIKDDKALAEIEMSMASGNPVGLSVECYLDKVLTKLSEQINKSKIKIEMKKNNKTLLERILKIFSEELFERALVPELGVSIEWAAPGETVNQVTVDDKGVETLAPIGVGEYNTDSGVIVVDETSKLVEVRDLPEQPAPAPEPAPAPADMAAYPWDQCISDQLAAGYSQTAADKICGYIKANNSAQVPLSDEILQSILTPEEYACKKKKLDDEFQIKLDVELVDPEMAPVSPDMLPPDGTDPNAPDVKAKTIGEIVGTADGEYYVKVVVEGGVVTEAEVSSETNLLKTSLEEVKKENSELKDKLKEPIGEPILAPEPQKKDWNKMSTYERVLERTRKE
jgi:hypothetical protein